MRKINIGAQGLEKLRSRNCFYVDKTEFIREWWEMEDDVALITRQRRFGKTLNMDTVNCFFSKINIHSMPVLPRRMKVVAAYGRCMYAYLYGHHAGAWGRLSK